MLSGISIDDCPFGEMTYHEMMERMPDIKEQLVKDVSAKIEKELESMKR